MDISTASSGMSIASTIVGNYYANKVAGIQADTANYVRGLNNKVVTAVNTRDNAITGLQRWRQGVRNSRVYEGAAKDQEASEVNYARSKDARARASFSDQVRFAEEEGRMAASAAASGVTGSVVDMLNATSRLRKGMQDTVQSENSRLADSDHQRQLHATYWANLDQLDYSLILDNPRSVDFKTDTPATKSLLSGVSGKDVKGVAQGVDFSFSSAKGSDSLDAFLALNDNFSKE
jgi:hypothetical protein